MRGGRTLGNKRGLIKKEKKKVTLTWRENKAAAVLLAAVAATWGMNYLETKVSGYVLANNMNLLKRGSVKTRLHSLDTHFFTG